MSVERRIAVAMSGGVDSSVAALLLKEQGASIFGVMLRLWSPGETNENRCCSPKDMESARRIAHQLEIPFYTYGIQDTFKKQVVDPFINGYAQGITPNPCIRCNHSIRWGALLDYVKGLGATHLATGHYAQILQRNGRRVLARARDREKDQSYILSILNPHQLSQTLFPLGVYLKSEVRQIAADNGFSVADRPDSQDLCFTGASDYYTFLQEYGHLSQTSGAILSESGKTLGTHDGLARFTIGQRKGIGISDTNPLYVLKKDAENNTLVVGPRDSLLRSVFEVAELNWAESTLPEKPINVLVQVRYKSPVFKGHIQPRSNSDRFRVTLSEPAPSITPGQLAAFYQDSVCLGGGIIQA
jgi:tRNA-specific 2-thiouridylase